MCSNFSALVVFSPTYLISKAPFGRTKHTHTFVVFPIINFDHKKLSHYKFYRKKRSDEPMSF